MPTIIHRAPVIEGDQILQHPGKGDSRFSDLLIVLRDFGLIDKSGNALKPYKLTRGVIKGFYLWHISWDGPAPTLESLKALHGRTFSSLSLKERVILEYFFENSRKHNVSIISPTQPEDSPIQVLFKSK